MTVDEAIAHAREVIDKNGSCWLDCHRKSCRQIVQEVAEEYNNGWIKVEFHEITEEERKQNFIAEEMTYWLDCRLPDHEEEIICTDGKNVWVDTNWIDDGYSLDSGHDWRDIVAWKPLPEPYKE